MTDEEALALKKEIRSEWQLKDSTLIREFKFKTFEAALDFVNRIASIAGKENHHPDIDINYNRVTLTLSTHAIKGLSKNDFILAAKIDALGF